MSDLVSAVIEIGGSFFYYLFGRLIYGQDFIANDKAGKITLKQRLMLGILSVLVSIGAVSATYFIYLALK